MENDYDYDTVIVLRDEYEQFKELESENAALKTNIEELETALSIVDNAFKQLIDDLHGGRCRKTPSPEITADHYLIFAKGFVEWRKKQPMLDEIEKKSEVSDNECVN